MFHDEILEFGIEAGLLGVGTVDPFGAEYLAAPGHAFVIAVLLVHDLLSRSQERVKPCLIERNARSRRAQFAEETALAEMIGLQQKPSDQQQDESNANCRPPQHFLDGNEPSMNIHAR